MPAALRNTLLSLRDLALTGGPFVLLVLVLLWLAYEVLDPNPPKKVVLATGAGQGAYAEFGQRYRERLKRYGIEVELRASAGAAENLRLLRDPDSGVDLAFVQGGTDSRRAARAEAEAGGVELISLGSLFYEPVWLFYREDSARRAFGTAGLGGLADLGRVAGGQSAQSGKSGKSGKGGWTLDVGTPGSGVPNLARRLLEANGVAVDAEGGAGALKLTQQDAASAVAALRAGRIDAVLLASAPESPLVQSLLHAPGIRLLDFPQAEAYSRRFAFLSPVLLPRGVIDLGADLPPADVRLVAPTAALAARDSLHPALAQLFVQAAQRIHGRAGWFQRKGDFPSTQGAEQTLADEAERFYRNGPPLLQRYLPFWLANLIDRMWVVLVSIIAILIPASRVLPPLYQFRVRSRIFRWYGQLRRVEDAIGQRPGRELLARLDDIERLANGVSVPLSYADELYALRGNIQLVRQRLLAASPEAADPIPDRPAP
jgi:hypothetical protein